jgi:integrase
MPTKKLDALSIPKLKPGEWYDALVPGLVLRVGKNKRTWYCRFHAGGTYKRKPLGHFPAMELAKARDDARLILDRADRGIPVAAPATPHPRSPDVLTLGALLDRYETMRLKEGHKVKALPKSLRQVRSHLEPYLALPVDQFSKNDLRAARDRLIDAGTIPAANRTLITLGTAMRWAAGEDLIVANFVPAIRRMKEAERSRVLTKSEIKAIWKACETFETDVAKNYARLVKFLLLTAQRRDEVASLKHGHILNGVWRQMENKASRPHSVPLPPLARALVGKGEASDYVFAGRSGAKFAGFSAMKRTLDEASGVSDWRLHDLRRTASTNMQELRIRNEVVQSVLNHSIPGVGGVYLRAELEREKAKALAAWATELVRIVGPRVAA